MQKNLNCHLRYFEVVIFLSVKAHPFLHQFSRKHFQFWGAQLHTQNLGWFYKTSENLQFLEEYFSIKHPEAKKRRRYFDHYPMVIANE